ncbi:DUF2333 family protein, partial [Kaarinaea lacus]
MTENTWQTRLYQLVDNIRALFTRLVSLYSPKTFREKGLWWSAGIIVITLCVILTLLGWYWSRPPDSFNAKEVALEKAGGDASRVVPGFTTTAALIQVAETLLDKPGGYLSNDKLPPASFFGAFHMLDNMPNWEFGVLVMIRDTSRVMRNDFSRSQSQSRENEALSQAEPLFHFPNDSWLFPPTEREYRKAINKTNDYLTALASQSDHNTQFFTRADNLNVLLAVVEKRLGDLSQRLNASVEELRVNTDLAGDTAAQQSTRAPGLIVAKTPWLEIDDVFYEARGYVWALLNIMRAVEVDFNS